MYSNFIKNVFPNYINVSLISLIGTSHIWSSPWTVRAKFFFEIMKVNWLKYSHIFQFGTASVAP